ncbi:hypothetical protein QBC37DRAFT_294949 [Rhypophila decipiens]|uniref:Uncharacterized protein n=1 Tax=Rhypophila decipiens TaxID=261697 RepID=A0AAN7B377_9PEZI|nr:hypothetical protein QBC37DRAFT_294949 [Rhypophila decipiens]
MANQTLLTAQKTSDIDTRQNSLDYHDDSEAFVDLPLAENGTRGRDHTRPRLRERVLRGVVAVFSLVIGVGLGTWYSSVTTSAAPSDLASSFGINTNTPIPRHIFTNRKNVPFIPHPEYMGASDEADDNWAALTAGSDTIYLPDPAQYNQNESGILAPFFTFTKPPPSAASLPNLKNFYVLNSLHQLHCVHMARKRYNMLVYSSQEKPVNPLAETPIDKDWMIHLEHCFEYLRLSITCADYMILESDSPAGSPEEYTKDGLGWGVTHSCIDWDGLMKFQKAQVEAYNRTWMG